MRAVSDVSLRAVGVEDRDFLYQVLLETMRDYVEATWGAWDEARVRAECAQRVISPEASVILVGGESAGLITVERSRDRMHLDQLYLLPQFQSQGIGTLLLKNLLAEARTCGQPVTLQVLQVNPARRLYERLGFVLKSETTERVFMEFSMDRIPAPGSESESA